MTEEKARGPIREEDFIGSIADALQYIAVFHEFVVEDMPVTVAVDGIGTSIHRTGPSRWRRPPILRVPTLAEA